MAEAYVEAGGGPPKSPFVVPGFRLGRLVDQDELGSRYQAEERSTGSVRTIRIVGRELTREQLDGLHRLWDGQRGRPVHPFLAEVVAHGATADGAPWVATDAGADGSLASRLATGPLPESSEVWDVATAAAGAVAALHAGGLVHGGISPSAIVSEAGAWRLTDAGVAAIVLPVPPPGADAPAGPTLAHAAPEVLAGASLTPAADVYALGATLAEALTGRPMVPWRRGDPAGVLLRRHLTDPGAVADGDGPAALVGAIGAACQSDPDRRPTAAALVELLSRTAGSPPIRVSDDDVQFTVYRPDAVQPERWYTMLAFAHKTDAAEPDFGPPDPVQEVKRQARAVLGAEIDRYVTAVEDSSAVLVRGSEITFVPHMEGVEFNPPQSSFRWVEAVQREEFRLRADRTLDGHRARGRLSVFVGTLLVADVNLTIRVDSAQPADGPPPELGSERARPYRKIFASYSHRDTAIVQQIGMLEELLGDEFIRDCSHLRSGEVWNDRLMELIEEADVFQLFWSTNSITSRFVRQEWEHALSLGRPSFVRPCYWEEPLPARPDEDLPPETLARLHFQRLLFGTDRPAAATPPSGTDAWAQGRPPTTPPVPSAGTGGPPPPTSGPSFQSAGPPGPPGPVAPSVGPEPVPPSVPHPPVSPAGAAPPEPPPAMSEPPLARSGMPRRILVALAGATSMIVLAVTGVLVAIVINNAPDQMSTTAPATRPPPSTVTTDVPSSSTPPSLTTPTTAPGPTILAARTNVPTVCLRGSRPDTANVVVTVRHAEQVESVELVSVHAGSSASTTMTPMSPNQSGAGPPAAPGATLFTATLGPYGSPGPVTWTVEAATGAGDVLRFKGDLQVDMC